ncbi:hypothetical protein ACFX11_019077 [Malus domestica]
MVTTGVLLATPLGPTVSTTPASSTSSVTQPIISVRRTDRRPQSFEEGQQSSEASSVYREGSQTGFRKCYSFRGGSIEFSVKKKNQGPLTFCGYNKGAAHCIGHRCWVDYQEPLPPHLGVVESCPTRSQGSHSS